MGIVQRIERALFGASAEEAVAMRVALIDRRIERALDQLADTLAADDDTDDDTRAHRGEGIEERQEGQQ